MTCFQWTVEKPAALRIKYHLHWPDWCFVCSLSKNKTKKYKWSLSFQEISLWTRLHMSYVMLTFRVVLTFWPITSMLVVPQRKLYVRRYFESENFGDVESYQISSTNSRDISVYFTEFLRCSCHTTLQF